MYFLKKSSEYFQKKWGNIFFIGYLLIILIICLNFAFNRIYFSDFYPANGDFQNYNGYRRLLEGQTPFKDFFYYLGLGPLYINSIPLLFLGNNFTNSLFVTNFITSSMFAISAYVVSRCNSLSKNKSILFALVLLLAACNYSGFGIISEFFKRYDFLDYVQPGNSDRMVRAFLPFLFVIIFVVSSKLKTRNKLFNHTYSKSIGFGLLLGSGISWSNDFGISAFISGSFIMLLLNSRMDKKSLYNILLYFIGCITGCYLLVNILTFGNFTEWFEYNFLGVAQYQFWYYATGYQSKLLILSDLPINLELIFCSLFILYYSVKILKKKHTINDIYLLFLFLTALTAGYAYAANSEKPGLFWPVYMILFISVFSILMNKIPFNNMRMSLILNTLFIVSGLLLTFSHLNETIDKQNNTREIFIPKLNGYLSQYGKELDVATNKLIKNNSVFSTYASALEVMSDQYQPTGMDYIIHVLGDKYREEYLEKFHSFQPEFVTTMREDFFPYELWVKRANWFFYREFLSSYKAEAVTPYSIIWRKQHNNTAINDEIQYQIEQKSDNSVEIVIKTDSKLNNAIADLSISYQSNWNSKRIIGYGLRKIVSVQDGWSSEKFNELGSAGGYNLPENASLLNIPIRIINGEGRTNLTSYPANLTNLKIISVEPFKIVPDVPSNLTSLNSLYKLEYIKAENLTDANWQNGINKNFNIALIKNTLENKATVEGSRYLETKSGNKIKIINIEYPDPEWIYVVLESVSEEIRYPNQIKFIE
ncbi:hypothetical protein DVH26_34115 [Paenibacillus sp. H1-7]|uniref:hypothetical protein n=1 Tax=Paenibacillus sp. H1-7 TaxID=2282849 RepID=UPI001EF9B3E4|nr:hypothetical protein [Paenibacillus sp. H1-7]ULL19025.1 hypothetical protein DVH26_34115 [Paenibacillus sp. H1-7]